MTDRQKATDFPKEVLALFDGYVHGFIDRRAFVEGAAKVVGGGAAAVAVLEALRYRSGHQLRCSVSPSSRQAPQSKRARVQHSSP